MITTSRRVLCIVLLGVSGYVFGQTTTSITDTAFSLEPTIATQNQSPQALTDAELDERLQTLQQLLQHNEKAASTWWVAWIGIYGSATIGQGLVAGLTTDKSTRQDMILGAGTTLLGMVGQFIAPVSSGYTARQFSQQPPLAASKPLSTATPLSSATRQELLTQAEAMLKFQANRARSGRNWQTQALCGAVNLTSGLITWLGFKRSVWEGVANFALNTAVSEIQIYSQPVRAIKDYTDCVTGYQRTYSLQAYIRPGDLCLVLNF